MKRLTGLLLYLFCFYLPAMAQDAGLPPPFVVKPDTAIRIQIPDANWQYLIVKGKTLSIKDILAYSAQFKNPAKSNKGIEGSQELWIRYQLKNGAAYPLEVTIPVPTDSADVYIAPPGQPWQKYRSGNMLPWSQKSGLKRINQLVYLLPINGVAKVYKRVLLASYKGKLNTDISIKANLVQREYIDNDSYQYDIIVSGMMVGFLSFAALFNFFFFYTVREKVYLVYAILLLLVACLSLAGALEDLALREYPTQMLYFRLTCTLLLAYLIFALLPMFLQTAKNHPRWNKRLFILNSCFSVSAFVMYVTRNTAGISVFANFFTVSLVIIMSVGLVVNIVADLVKKRFEARLFLLAITPFIFLMCLYLILSAIFKQRLNWLEITIDFCLVWAIIVLSWSLFDRHKVVMHQNTLQILENERVAREAQQERSKLIAEQNEILEKQVAERTAELNDSITHLKQTQTQLIQAEKMASLGELTAGIAHEIQNPLNFVNNFSEVSVELLEELVEEADAGNIEDVKAIAGDLTQNLQKINHHGKRADGIVKGMLQHSRAGGSVKEPVDINKLADEYLRLAYHGLRSKDKNFNAELVTNFAEGLPLVPVVSQDIGRVLLNLFTNAFYAMQQKQKVTEAGYKPLLTVTTFPLPLANGGWGVKVRDNGIGIPEGIRDKILQPFFTTKPTGEGTGLGLSLSYDIVVKAHNGKIEINSAEGEYTEFIISIPATT